MENIQIKFKFRQQSIFNYNISSISILINIYFVKILNSITNNYSIKNQPKKLQIIFIFYQLIIILLL